MYFNFLKILSPIAPVVGEDSSDEESDDDENNGTQWGQTKKEIIVGEEEGLSFKICVVV